MKGFLLLIFPLILCEAVIDDVSLRPKAIIPWSEFQQKRRASTAVPNSDKFSVQRQMQPRLTEEMMLQRAVLEELKREQDQQETLQKSSGFIIRPQIRKKISEPSDFQRMGISRAQQAKKLLTSPIRVPPHYNPPISSEQYPYQRLNNLPSPPPHYNTKTVQLPTNLNIEGQGILPAISHYQQHQNIAQSRMEKPTSSYEKFQTQKKVDGLRMAQFLGQQTSSASSSHSQLAVPPNEEMMPSTIPRYRGGLPFGVLRNGVPVAAPNSREDQIGLARQFGSSSFVDPSVPLEALNQAHFTRIAPASSLPTDQNSNIVNAIFTQSQQRPFAPIQGAPNSLIQGIQQVPLGSQAGAANPLEQLLANGSPLDQISKIAKNIFLNGNENGQNDLLSAGLRALQQQGGPIESAATETRSSPSMMEKLFSSAAQALNHSLKEQQRQAKIDAIKKEEAEKAKKEEENKRSLTLLEGVPEDQKALLEAAIRSGEIDSEALKPILKTLVKEESKEGSKKETANRLLEWIEQNRPKKEDVVVASDKLPYYGTYCGSFSGQQNNSSRKFRPSGALWAVDNRRLIVSKFFFQPGSILTENVTFWGGPNNATGDPISDIFPSENGFYLRPQPIDISIFAIPEVPPIEAKIRKSIPANITVNGALPVQPALGLSEDKNITNILTVRRRRDAAIHVQKDEMPPPKTQKNDDDTIHLVVKGGMVRVENPNSDHVAENCSSTEIISSPAISSTSTFPVFRIKQPEEDALPDPSIPSPLEWYDGFQPLLITLPEDKTIKTTHWISLRDHRRKESVASVLIPNGPAFEVPHVTSLRPLTTKLHISITSGPIKILDRKTIEINNLKIKSDGIPLWFMIGSDVLPNAGGHIVPLYEPTTGHFDCDSLRDYTGETVTIRLPGKMDVKDVFWFSVFSMTTATSYSEIYLPYNDIHVPANLQGISTPHCKWTSA